MTSLLNAVDLDLGVFNNYVTDVAVSVLFGMGYYLVRSIRNRNKNSAKSSSLKMDKAKSALKNRIENALQRWNYAKTLEDYHQLIKYESCDPYEILNMMVSKGLSPNIDTYNALLLNCFHNANFSAAENITQDILDMSGPVIANNYTLNILIKGASLKMKQKNTHNSNEISNFEFDEEVKKIISILSERGVEADIIAHNTIIDALIDQGRLEDAFSKYNDLKRGNKLQFDFYTYTSLMKGIRLTPIISEKWLDTAFYIFREAVEMCKTVEESFYNSLLDTCVKFGKIERAEEVFDLICKTFPNPKEYSYCIMIKGYSKVYNFPQAMKMFQELKRNSSVSTISYGCILNACVRCKNISSADNIFSEMLGSNMECNAFIYSTMIKAYAIKSSFFKAYALYKKVSEENKLTIAVFNSMLDACVECEQFDKMNEIYEHLKKICNDGGVNPSTTQIQPDIITYSTVMKGYAKNNNIDKVMDIYNFITSNSSFKLDQVLYNTLLDCFARNKDEMSLFQIYSDMKRNNIEVGYVTYGVLIKLYTNLGKINKANEIYNDMVNKGFRPSIIIFQLLIRLYSSKGLPFKVIEVLDTMTAMDVAPDHIFYDSIIKICINFNMLIKASELISKSLNQGIKLEDSLYEEFIYWIIHSYDLCKNQKRKMLSDLFNQFKSKNCSLPRNSLEMITRFIYNSNMNYRVRSGRKENRRTNIVEEEKSIYV